MDKLTAHDYYVKRLLDDRARREVPPLYCHFRVYTAIVFTGIVSAVAAQWHIKRAA
jgi:hypothetical protein